MVCGAGGGGGGGGGAIDISAKLRCCTTLSDNPKGNCDLTEITLAKNEAALVSQTLHSCPKNYY